MAAASAEAVHIRILGAAFGPVNSVCEVRVGDRVLPGMAMQMLMTGQPITAQEAHRLGMVNQVHPRTELMKATLAIAEKIADNSPTAIQAVKRAVQLGQEPVEQAVATMMEQHWRSVHPDRVEASLLHRGPGPHLPRPRLLTHSGQPNRCLRNNSIGRNFANATSSGERKDLNNLPHFAAFGRTLRRARVPWRGASSS